MGNTYVFVMYFLYATLVFFLPLIFVGNTSEAYEFPKTFLVYAFGILLFGSFLIRRIIRTKKIVVPSAYVLAFVGMYILSTVFSMHRYTSLWGYYGRFNGGLLSVTAFFLLYFAAINIFSKEVFGSLINFSILSFVFVSIFGISQYISGVGRVYSTIGQPNWLAQFLVMILPLVLYRYFKSAKPIPLFFIYSLGFFCLWLTFSMSGIAALLASLVILMWIIKSTLTKTRVMLIIAVMVIVIFFFPGMFKQKADDIYYDLERFFGSLFVVNAETLGYKISDPGYIREGLWTGTIKLIFSSPKVFLIGSGPATFPYAFQEYRPKVLNHSSEWDFVFNKPHNYYLELWSEIGLLGFLSYLFLVASLLKRLPKQAVPSVVAFLVTNLFGWPVTSTVLLFWGFIAYARL